MGYRNIPLAVRHEYGESLTEAIKGFALMGSHMTVAAQVMEIDYKTFRGWVKRLNLSGLFVRRNYKSEYKQNQKGRPHRRRYSDEDLLRQVVACRYMCARAINKKPSAGAIIGRFGSWGNAKCKAKEMENGRINKD